MATTLVPTRLSRPPAAVLRYLWVVAIVGLTIDGGIYTVLLNLYLLRLGYGPAFIGLLNSAGLFVFAAISLPVGSITRWSSRKMLAIGVTLTLVGMTSLPMIQWGPQLLQAPLLVASRVIALVGLSFFFVHAPPFIGSIAGSEWRHRALSLQTAALALAGFAGGIVGGFLPGLIAGWLDLPPDHPAPYQYPLILASILLLPAATMMWRIPEPADSPDRAQVATSAEKPKHGRVTPMLGLVSAILLVRFLQMGGVGMVNTFTNVYLDDGLGVSTSVIGVITAVGRLAGVPVALTVPAILARWGTYRSLIVTMFILVSCIIPMALIASWPVAGFAYIAVSSLGSIRYLSFLLFSMDLVPVNRQAIMSGAGEMAIGLSFATMSFIGGYLIVWYGYSTIFLVGALLSLAGTIFFALHFRRSRAIIAV